VIESFTVTMRRHLAEHLAAESTLPVFRYQPDDITQLPCLVIGRPGKTETELPSVMTMRLDIVLLGRRVNDDDSQAELDAYDDATFAALGSTRSFKLGDVQYRCVEGRAGTASVAAMDYPAYSYTVVCDISTC
jgi:hypothetical protein